ncbi:CAP domain-containing protein [Clostridioides sp. ZZV14-6345]|uniref:CAP domain-containing protein n=1 Tax=Clostridioides sp. ZZV14-6345 TaxID=2811496 RepID=UPI001D12A84F|nr:sporulation protein [Clostridioides sp. ZZV14-6345]
MRKNIPTKLKTILALGVLTLATASSAVTASASSLENNVNISNKSLVYSNTKYKFSAKPNCSVKPELKPDNNKPESNKPDDNNNSGSTNENFSAYQKEVVDLVNIERSKAGLNPLTLDSSISNVATKKSQDMIDNNYFSHNSPTYGSPFDMLKKFGISYKTAGENIAMGQKTPKEVVNAWMNSEGHRKNIMNPNFSKIGVGVAQKSGGSIYWTQIFVG